MGHKSKCAVDSQHRLTCSNNKICQGIGLIHSTISTKSAANFVLSHVFSELH